jgi:hypothetical protein
LANRPPPNGNAGNPYRRDDEPHRGARNSGGQRISLSDEERRKLDRQRQGVIGRITAAE